MIIRLLFLCAFFIPHIALAQINVMEGKEGEVIAEPICTYLTNRSDQTIMGTIFTAPQVMPSGDKIRHQRNFRLSSGAREQICAAGPFYEGRRIELMIRTIIPLFTCKTALTNEIFLDATAPDNLAGMKKLSATCY